jgi:hypothetical protein
MARQEQLSQWTACVSTNMPHLSRPQAQVLAWWSFGIALTGACGRLGVATFLALLLKVKVANVEQRLYEWCLEAEDKAGTQRQHVDVIACQQALLRWIVRLWSGTQLAVTLDATSLGNRFVALVVSVVYRGIGIPVAWTIIPAGRKGQWRKAWLRMVRQIRPAIPSDWTVIVLADRGLYARWLFRRIVRLGWHPFLRINTGCKFRPAGKAQWYWLTELVGEVGQQWQGRGTCFKGRDGQLACTLLAWWGDGYADPWFVLTDLDPSASTVTWYGLRGWCEQGFKCTKRGGWQWQQTRMTDPQRAARIWLAMAVAMLWTVSVGSDLELGPTDTVHALPDLRPLLGTSPVRRIRLFRLGRLWLLVTALTIQILPLPTRLVPEPWPAPPRQSNQSLPY